MIASAHGVEINQEQGCCITVEVTVTGTSD